AKRIVQSEVPCCECATLIKLDARLLGFVIWHRQRQDNCRPGAGLEPTRSFENAVLLRRQLHICLLPIGKNGCRRLGSGYVLGLAVLTENMHRKHAVTSDDFQMMMPAFNDHAPVLALMMVRIVFMRQRRGDDS